MVKDRGNKLICRIDVTGFLSILVVLVFTYMIHLMDYPDLPAIIAELPRAQHGIPMSRANREDAMVVTIMRDGRIGFGTWPVSLGELPKKLREGLRNGSERRVYIKVDAQAKYSAVDEVLNQIRLAGIEKISFLTEKPI